MPDDPLARASAIEFLRQLSTPAHLTSVPPTSQGVDDVFRVETGMTVSAWQRAARMRAARDLLATGAKPGSVAGRVGYTSLSAFSHAFIRFHGLSPRTYQQREAGTP